MCLNTWFSVGLCVWLEWKVLQVSGMAKIIKLLHLYEQKPGQGKKLDIFRYHYLCSWQQ